MESMAKFQDESGMWYQVVNMGGREKNYLETSGSAIMAYSMLKGVRLGSFAQSVSVALWQRRHSTVFVIAI